MRFYYQRVCVCIGMRDILHSQVMSWFADCPNPQVPFSMHALMDQAVRHDNQPGDWFGPSQVSILMRYAFLLFMLRIMVLHGI